MRRRDSYSALKVLSSRAGATTNGPEARASNSQLISARHAQPMSARGSATALEPWRFALEEKLKNALGKSLEEQNIVVREIMELEPHLSRVVVVDRFVRTLLAYAINSNIDRREWAIRRISELEPAFDRRTVVAKLNQMALGSLPAWVSSSFWSREVDPILLIGIRNAHEEFEAAVDRIRSLSPTLTLSQITERYTAYRSKKRDSHFATIESMWPSDADAVLREAIAIENRTEREAILRVLRQHKELRPAAIQQRMRTLQRRFISNQQYGRFAWTEEINDRLLQASKNNDLAEVVARIASECGRSREIVYKHCERLGIPRKARKALSRWNEADLQYLMDHVNHQSTARIAEALGRSCSSVGRKIQQLGLSTAVPKYSLRDLRRDLHVRHSTIVRWIAEGKLKVALKKRKVKRGQQQHIHDEDLLEFLRTHHQELNLAKLEPHIRLVIDEALGRNSADG